MVQFIGDFYIFSLFQEDLDALHSSRGWELEAVVRRRWGGGEAADLLRWQPFRRRAKACDSASPIWLTSSGEAGGQAEAYLPKQPGLHHTSRRKNCHDSTTTHRENERVATGSQRRENREVEMRQVLGGDQQHIKKEWDNHRILWATQRCYL